MVMRTQTARGEVRVGINLIMAGDLVDKLDDWRFANRFDNRAEAIRWLLEFGMDAHPQLTEEELEEKRAIRLGNR